MAALFAAAIALVLRPDAIVVAGLAGLALAVHLFVWDPERHELFADDWLELGMASASLISGVLGLSLLVAGLMV